MRVHALLPILICALLVGCSDSPSPDEQAAVESVWDQYIKGMVESLDEFTAEAEGARVDPWTRSHLAKVQFYRDVDVSRCPRPFQTAWADYLTALQAYDPTAALELMKEESADPFADIAKVAEAERPLKEAEGQLGKAFEKYSPKLALEFAEQREYEESRK